MSYDNHCECSQCDCPNESTSFFVSIEPGAGFPRGPALCDGCRAGQHDSPKKEKGDGDVTQRPEKNRPHSRSH